MRRAAWLVASDKWLASDVNPLGPVVPSEDFMSLRLSTEREMGEALWSAVACYRFRSDQLAGRRAATAAWETRPRASSRDQSGSKLPHSRAPAALKARLHSRCLVLRFVCGRLGLTGGADSSGSGPELGGLGVAMGLAQQSRIVFQA